MDSTTLFNDYLKKCCFCLVKLTCSPENYGFAEQSHTFPFKTNVLLNAIHIFHCLAIVIPLSSPVLLPLSCQCPPNPVHTYILTHHHRRDYLIRTITHHIAFVIAIRSHISSEDVRNVAPWNILKGRLWIHWSISSKFEGIVSKEYTQKSPLEFLVYLLKEAHSF